MTNLLAKRYEIIRTIGQGGMADVYLAKDIILNREVAIKILRGELSNDAVSLIRFKREANSISNLSHPNIVEIYDKHKGQRKKNPVSLSEFRSAKVEMETLEAAIRWER